LPNCEICKTPITRNPRPNSKPVKTCGKDKCRLELRRRVGREQAAKAKARKESIPMRECLGSYCTTMIPKGAVHFCERCRVNRKLFPVYSDAWGAAI